MKTAILLHLHYQELWPEFWSYLKDIKDENTHLYVTVHTVETEWYNDIKNNSTEVFLIENKGADFGGFLYVYNKIKHDDYSIITKLHGKKSLRLEAGQGEKWRKQLYLPLIKDKQTYAGNISLFKNDSKLFMLGSKEYIRVTGGSHIDENRYIIKSHSSIQWIDDLLHLTDLVRNKHISGAMFMCTKNYLNMFFKDKEYEIFQNSEKGYGNQITSGHHLECTICNCDHFGGYLLGV